MALLYHLEGLRQCSAGVPWPCGAQSLVGETGIKTPQSVIDVSYRERRIRCSERSREAEGTPR